MDSGAQDDKIPVRWIEKYIYEIKCKRDVYGWKSTDYLYFDNIVNQLCLLLYRWRSKK